MKALQNALSVLFLFGFALGFVSHLDRSLAYGSVLLCLVSLVSLIVVSAWLDANHPAWQWLVERYGVARSSGEGGRCEEHRVFFRESNEKEFDSHNVIRVSVTDAGIEFQPTLTTFLVQPIKIPKADLEFVKDVRITLVHRRIFRVKDSSVEIALTRAFVRHWLVK